MEEYFDCNIITRFHDIKKYQSLMTEKFSEGNIQSIELHIKIFYRVNTRLMSAGSMCL